MRPMISVLAQLRRFGGLSFLSRAEDLLPPTGRCMASAAATSEAPKQPPTIKVVLLTAVPRLGAKGSVVEANAGWVRTTLFPQGKSVYATPANVERHSMSTDERQLLEDAGKVAQRRLDKLVLSLATMRVTIMRRMDWRVKGGPEGKEGMHGEVTAWDVVEATRRQAGVCLHQSHLMMKESISQAGEYKIPLNLRTRGDRQVELTVVVKSVRSISHGHQFV